MGLMAVISGYEGGGAAWAVDVAVAVLVPVSDSGSLAGPLEGAPGLGGLCKVEKVACGGAGWLGEGRGGEVVVEEGEATGAVRASVIRCAEF